LPGSLCVAIIAHNYACKNKLNFSYILHFHSSQNSVVCWLILGLKMNLTTAREASLLWQLETMKLFSSQKSLLMSQQEQKLEDNKI